MSWLSLTLYCSTALAARKRHILSVYFNDRVCRIYADRGITEFKALPEKFEVDFVSKIDSTYERN